MAEQFGGFTIGDPHPGLRGYVERYIGYAERAAAPLTRRELPHSAVVVVIGWDAPLEITDPRAPQRGVRAASFTAGLFDSYVDTRLLGVGRGVELLLTPLAAGRILGLPIGELANQVVAVDDLPGRWLHALRVRLAEASGWAQRFLLLDAALTARLAATRPADPWLRWIWDRLVSCRGQVGIGDLAAELGWSRRHFTAVFRREIGLQPKTMARVLRFEQAYSQLEHVSQKGGWSVLATDCGYYDQAHLIRDFRDFAGTTPTGLAAVRPVPAGVGR